MDDLWRTMVATEGRSRKYVYNVRSTLTQALKAAERDGLVERNASHLSQVTASHRAADHADSIRERVLSEEQMTKLATWCLDNIDAHQWAMPTLLALDSGMRRGEILALRHDDVDTAQRNIRIERSLTYVPRSKGIRPPELGPPKSRSSRRTIQVPARTIVALEQHLRSTPRAILGLVFHDDGDVTSPNAWTQWMGGQRGALSKFLDWDFTRTPHDLRHTHASMLLRHGVPVTDVAKRLGHDTPATTMRNYAWAIPSGVDPAAEAWAALVDQSS